VAGIGGAGSGLLGFFRIDIDQRDDFAPFRKYEIPCDMAL
jgi:hypothetical protein